jgi:hypothetical protein
MARFDLTLQSKQREAILLKQKPVCLYVEALQVSDSFDMYINGITSFGAERHGHGVNVVMTVYGGFSQFSANNWHFLSRKPM